MNRLVWFSFLLAAATVPLSSCTAQTRHPSSGVENASAPVETGQVVRECPECPELIRVVGVGDNGRSLFIGRYELLWREYYRSVVEGGCAPPANIDGTVLQYDPGKEDPYPITSIKPIDIHCYLSWISKKTGKTFRLPTEQEWIRIAALSGVEESDNIQVYPRSRAFLRDMSNPFLGLSAEELNAMTPANSERREAVRLGAIAPVGLKEPDKLGLYDLIGNLPELITDLPPDVLPVVFGRQTVAAKGAGLSTLETNHNLLVGYERFFAELRSNLIGYRIIRED